MTRARTKLARGSGHTASDGAGGGGRAPRPHYDPGMKRISISGGAVWEPIIGYSRLVRVGPHIYVTGTTSFLPGGGHVGDGDAYAQAKQIFANIATALSRVDASLDHVVRTRMYVTDIERDWQAVGRAHGEAVGHVRPAATMIEVSRLLETWMMVEIEVDAYVD